MNAIEEYQARQAAAINAHIAAGGTVELMRVNPTGPVIWRKIRTAVQDGARIILWFTDAPDGRSIGTAANDTFTLQWRAAPCASSAVTN